jgi:hypothetical protein
LGRIRRGIDPRIRYSLLAVWYAFCRGFLGGSLYSEVVSLSNEGIVSLGAGILLSSLLVSEGPLPSFYLRDSWFFSSSFGEGAINGKVIGLWR